jgi:cation:H+ antiporter
MNPLLIFSLAVIAGCIGLVWGAHKFVLGAATTAHRLAVPPLVIGLTIVAFGTSAPEIFTSLVASVGGAPELAIGNVIGSNIANIGLILGLTLVIRPVLIPLTLMRREIPVLVAVTLGVVVLLTDYDLDRQDGLLLLLMLALFLWLMYHSRRVARDSEITNAREIAEFLTGLALGKAVVLMLWALALLILSSNVVVWGARNIALGLGVSELVVGLTVVAVGTSLPELATSVTSVLRGHDEIAIGNVVGSNILNLLLVLPVPALLANAAISPLVINRDVPVMLALTLLLSLLLFGKGPRAARLGRKSGTVFIIFYLAYTAALILTSSNS